MRDVVVATAALRGRAFALDGIVTSEDAVSARNHETSRVFRRPRS